MVILAHCPYQRYLKEMKGKWSDPRVTLVREKGLDLIKAILKGSVSMVCSMEVRLCLIRSRIAQDVFNKDWKHV